MYNFTNLFILRINLTTLYKTTKQGKIQQWSIEVVGDSFICTYGQVNGKMQEQSTKCTGKNIGRANESTPEQQAVIEAAALVEKKKKSGYSTDKSAPVIVQLPQKVKSYQDQIKNVKFKCFSTEKLNGVNGTYWLLPDNSLKLTSRGGETYPAIPHLEADIKTIMKHLGLTSINLELYIHGEHLQDIQSAVKKPKELSKKLEANIFEFPEMKCSYEVKRQIMLATMDELSNFFEQIDMKVNFLTGVECHSHEDIEAHYNQCMAKGLEGTVIYNADAEYKFNTRSSSVFKYKKTIDGEYQIVDMEVDKNRHPVFHCITTEGKVFKVKPKGTDSERKAIVASFESNYLHQWYNISYECLSKGKVPLKPVGNYLRPCDNSGNPTI